METPEWWLGVLKAIGSYGTPATLIIIGLLTWWRVLPALIEAISNRQSKIEERMAKLLDTTTERFERQLKEADQRHEDCIEGQRLLLTRIDEQDEKLSAQSKLIEEQRDQIAGLKAQLRTLQIAAVRLDGHPISDMARGVVTALENLETPPSPPKENLS